LISRMTSFDTLSEYEIAHIMKQIFSAVHYCHGLHVVHRDLKLENILFTHGKPSLMLKVIDFGRSKFLKPLEKVNELAGTVSLV
jgi:calcium-dependent protein kinase